MALTVHGIARVRHTFSRLSTEVRKEILDGALRAGSAPIVAAAKRLAPVIKNDWMRGRGAPRRDPGILRDSITAWLSRRVRPDSGVVRIGPRKGRGLDPFFAGWVEYGHIVGLKKSERAVLGITRDTGRRIQRRRAKLGAAGTFVPPVPFMRPALLQAGAQAGDIVRNYLLAAVQKIANEP